MSTETSKDDRIEEARRLFRKRRYDESIALFSAVLEQEEARPDAHEGIANAYFAAGNYEKAIEHFQRHSALDMRQGRSCINLGAVYNRMGEYKKAVDVLRKGIPREKKSPFGYYNLGLAYRGLEQHAMAVSAYREAIRIDPTMAEAHQNLANVLVEMKNNQQAIIHYRKALELKPGFKRAEAGLARAEGRIADAKKGEKPFGRLVDEDRYRRPAGNTFTRALNEIERSEDRQAVYTLAQQLEAAAVSFLHQIRNDFEPNLLHLSREFSQDASAVMMTRAYEQFRRSLAEIVRLRRDLKRRALELRAHEEMMYAPSVNVPTIQAAPRRV